MKPTNVNERKTNQPTLFDSAAENIEVERVLLYALGEFQARGKVLAERELALDRLRGAFKRAAEKFGLAKLSDEQISENLIKLNAKVQRVPNFVAKHPFRITIQTELAEKALDIYQKSLIDE